MNWQSVPTYGSGTSDITMTFTANLRSKLHVFTASTDTTTDFTDHNDYILDYSSGETAYGTEFATPMIL